MSYWGGICAKIYRNWCDACCDVYSDFFLMGNWISKICIVIILIDIPLGSGVGAAARTW